MGVGQGPNWACNTKGRKPLNFMVKYNPVFAENCNYLKLKELTGIG
jgi:hypothetical protein